MKIKLRRQTILTCLCGFLLSACAMIQEDTQAPFELLSPSVMAMIQQDAMNRPVIGDSDGETPANPNAISIEALLQNALNNSGKITIETPIEGVNTTIIPKPTKKPNVKAG